MILTIELPDEWIAAILRVLDQDLAPEWLRTSWTDAGETGLDQLSPDEIDAEIAAARKTRR